MDGAPSQVVIRNLDVVDSLPDWYHMNLTLWVLDNAVANGTPGACSSAFNRCWVEIGIVNWGNGGDTYYFGDVRPGDTGFWYHPLAAVQPGDINNIMELTISRNPGASFSWWIDRPVGSTLSGYSTPNTMISDRISIGGEVEGAGDAPSQVTSGGEWHFKTNMYKSSGAWWFQFREGDTQRVDAPQWVARWTVIPTRDQSTQGGNRGMRFP
jgi:hypothetical protein